MVIKLIGSLWDLSREKYGECRNIYKKQKGNVYVELTQLQPIHLRNKVLEKCIKIDLRNRNFKYTWNRIFGNKFYKISEKC